MPALQLQCRKCQRVIPPEDFNVATNIALCRGCGEMGSLSDLMAAAELRQAADTSTPPNGAWYRNDGGETVIGASERSLATAAFTLFFSLFWNSIVSVFVLVDANLTLGALGVHAPTWLPMKMTDEPFHGPANLGMGGFALFLWLFLTPFIGVGLLMLTLFLRSIAGRTEVRLGANEGRIFAGVGRIGWTRRFAADKSCDVRIETSYGRRHSTTTSIVLTPAGGKPIRFGGQLSTERRTFVAGALRKALR
jgi:hypothetical protein